MHCVKVESCRLVLAFMVLDQMPSSPDSSIREYTASCSTDRERYLPEEYSLARCVGHRLKDDILLRLVHSAELPSHAMCVVHCLE